MGCGGGGRGVWLWWGVVAGMVGECWLIRGVERACVGKGKVVAGVV